MFRGSKLQQISKIEEKRMSLDETERRKLKTRHICGGDFNGGENKILELL